MNKSNGFIWDKPLKNWIFSWKKKKRKRTPLTSSSLGWIQSNLASFPPLTIIKTVSNNALHYTISPSYTAFCEQTPISVLYQLVFHMHEIHYINGFCVCFSAIEKPFSDRNRYLQQNQKTEKRKQKKKVSCWTLWIRSPKRATRWDSLYVIWKYNCCADNGTAEPE